MPKPKEQPKVRIYVYEHLLEMLREKFPQLALQTDSEIVNHLMTKELGTVSHIPVAQKIDDVDETVGFDDDVD